MKLIRIILTVITLIVILTSVGLSGQTASESVSVSDKVLIILKIVPENEVIHKSMAYRTYSVIFREVAHLVLYSIITLPTLLLLYSWLKRLKFAVLLTIVVVMIYAFFDEVHQTYVLGRTFEYFDLLMDFIGCLLTVSIATVSIWVSRCIVKNIGR